MLRKVSRGKGNLRPMWTGLTVVVVTWWLLLAGVILWIMPERVVVASPTPTPLRAGATVRITRSGNPLFPIARDRAGFDEMRLAVAARYEEPTAESIASFESINVEDGHVARVLTVDGDAVQIELLDGDHAGERAWIRMGALRLG